MADESWPWQGDAVGDATPAPWDEDEIGDILRTLFVPDDALYGVLQRYENELEVTNPSGLTIRQATGAGIVYGSFYESDADVDHTVVRPGGGNNYYRVVLRKSWAAKTVRSTLLGPNAVALPTITQNPGVTYDVNLCDITVPNVGALTLVDQRYFLITNMACVPRILYRCTHPANYDWSGETNNFNIALSGIEVHHNARAQPGTIRWTGGAAASGNVAVTFPQEYTYKPHVFVTPQNTLAAIVVSVVITTSGFTLYWEDVGGTNRTSLDFMWLAIGPISAGA